MLTFLASVVIMVAVVGTLVAWATREERRRSASGRSPHPELEASRRS
jgi:hypothetical protein